MIISRATSSGIRAGIFGLIKASLALEHKTLPPSIHFDTPNKKIDWLNSATYVNTETKKWNRIDKDTPRRCGVSSFGLSGTNAHVVLEEAPKREVSKNEKPTELNTTKYNILTLSAKSTYSLKELVKNYISFLGDKENKNINISDMFII